MAPLARRAFTLPQQHFVPPAATAALPYRVRSYIELSELDRSENGHVPVMDWGFLGMAPLTLPEASSAEVFLPAPPLMGTLFDVRTVLTPTNALSTFRLPWAVSVAVLLLVPSQEHSIFLHVKVGRT